MRVVLTNDDGVDALGLAALRLAVAAVPGLQPVVVAPLVCWSSCGHALTLRDEIRCEFRAEGVWAVDGSPADCVRAALTHLAPGATAVLSGINHGGNLGFDVHVSGTVAAAREAAAQGVRGVAISHYLRRGVAIDWERAAAWVAALLPELLATTTGYAAVNLPHLDPGTPDPLMERCPLDPSPLPLVMERTADGVRYVGNYHNRIRLPGHDVAVCFGGRISRVELG